ncbi:MAG: hypothetical protein M3Y08_14520 [Fibrobacterota bacterium]|nr:hypothetical protein [Fibrobacterota bacterium]
MDQTQAWTYGETKVDDAARKARDLKEGVENAADKVAGMTPSLLFPAAALVSIVFSAILQLSGRKQWALFVGHWAPSFLLFGLYNKAIKTMGPA